MSTALWANHRLDDGTVASDECDKLALFRHAGKLDRLAREAGLTPFSSLFDDTDCRVNLGHTTLPEGMTSTTELMARDGVWVAAEDALVALTGLLDRITIKRPRFGLVRNDYDAVVAELAETIAFAEQARALGARFNLAIVM